MFVVYKPQIGRKGNPKKAKVSELRNEVKELKKELAYLESIVNQQSAYIRALELRLEGTRVVYNVNKGGVVIVK